MANKNVTHASEKDSATTRKPQPIAGTSRYQAEQANPADTFARAMTAPANILALQRAAGNRAVQHMLEAMMGRPDERASKQANHQFDSPGGQRAQASGSIAPQIFDKSEVLTPQYSTPMNAIQRKTKEEDELPQMKFETTRKKDNKTGLPDDLKAGIENLSGMAMDDVKVHYNSSAPAKMQALAYTQGTDIHLAPEEEEHLPHEAWHVVQQKQGRVKATRQMKEGDPVNDDHQLEHEADVMGAKALKMGQNATPALLQESVKPARQLDTHQPIQRVVADTIQEKLRLWGDMSLAQINEFKVNEMAAFWNLVRVKLQPAYAKFGDVQQKLSNIHSYMIHPDIRAKRELDSLKASAPAIDNAPAIRDNDANTLLNDLKRRVGWIYARKNVYWDQAINTALNNRKENLSSAEQWQVYGEALAAVRDGGQDKNMRWNVMATRIATDIKNVGNQANAALNTWLDDISTRTTRIQDLWTRACAPVQGTHGSIPRATVEKLFIDYEPRMRRSILCEALENKLGERDWGGVKYINHNKYARELKIHAMGGADRVFSKNATPAVFDTIDDIHD